MQSMNVLTIEEQSELQALEEELWREETRFDIARMRELMSEDFFEFGMSGRTYSLEDTLAIAAQEIRAKIPLPDFSARSIYGSVVQVTYNSAVEYDGKIIYARRSSIWIRENGAWKLKFHQGTPYEPST